MKRQKYKVTFLTPTDQDPISDGWLGQTTTSIMNRTGLTRGQVEYKFKLEGQLTGRKKGQATPRRMWREGTSPLFLQLRKDIINVLRADVEARLAAKRVHAPRHR